MEAFLQLIAEGNINVKPLITHQFPFERALEAYDLILSKTQETYLAVLFQYDTEKGLENKVLLKQVTGDRKQDALESATQKQIVSIGVIGAGNFAKGVLLPNLKRIAGAQIRAIATATGLSATHVGKKFDAEYVTSDYNEILADPNIDAVLIATRHDLHAQLVIEGMEREKAVFVEKPLALSQEELNKVIEVQQETGGLVMVGFNRRFSPLAVKVKEFFANRKGPICIIYRVNAGFVPKEHWIQDDKQGGGRIIGEVCHFVDVMQYLTNSMPQTVFAQPVCDATGTLMPHDNVMITLQFENGSIGTISYLSNGDVTYGKERVEIFGDGAVALIDDFKRVEISCKGKRQKFGGNLLTGQKKGHREELAAFVEAIRAAKPLPISFEESVTTTKTTFKVIESISEGKSKRAKDKNTV